MIAAERVLLLLCQLHSSAFMVLRYGARCYGTGSQCEVCALHRCDAEWDCPERHRHPDAAAGWQWRRRRRRCRCGRVSHRGIEPCNCTQQIHACMRHTTAPAYGRYPDGSLLPSAADGSPVLLTVCQTDCLHHRWLCVPCRVAGAALGLTGRNGTLSSTGPTLLEGLISHFNPAIDL